MGPKFHFFGKVSAPCLADPLRNWELQACPSLDEFTLVQNVLQMGFDATLVVNLVENKYMLTGTFYLSESELISDLLQPAWEESSSAEGSRGMPDSIPTVLVAV